MKIKVLSSVIFFLSISVIFAAKYDEFVDSRGQCWRCYPNKPCEKCPTFKNSKWPMGWSDLCFEPNCNIAENRKFLFPSREADRYFKCVEDRGFWTYESVRCPCGTLFDIKSQKCVDVKSWTAHCVEQITPVTLRSCATKRRVPISDYRNGDVTIWESTTEPVTTENNCRCVMWFPCRCNPCWTMPCQSCNGCTG